MLRIWDFKRKQRSNLWQNRFESGASGALGPALLQNIPEIEQAVRVLNIKDSWLSSGDSGFYHQFCLADQNFPNMFSMTFITGGAKTSLNQPYGIIISQSIAHRFFGKEDSIGKTISSGDRYFSPIAATYLKFIFYLCYRESVVASTRLCLSHDSLLQKSFTPKHTHQNGTYEKC